ncbi:murein hydrolase effector protein LrgB [Erysipelothrix larvae]|uniref:Murein hydrolase effector protein LrgB n=1 Tax=Erysipelothrix larvae TaxID=1514105 RepID=A0A0X8H0N8_9FIRM|nr:LrgB family protein [Erysipelothrix larvae]AMC93892.1 murein hydrolase effector protein LrgB [Erysipelothrix larvae]
MRDLIVNPLFSLTLTFGVYGLVSLVSKRVKSPLFNPLMISSVVIIGMLILVDLPYQTYAQATNILTRLIAPATVCLAIPLYQNTQILKQYIKPILMGCVVGVSVHAVCISILSALFDLNISLIVSLFPKSVTTAIAQDLALSYGGNASITVPIVILTGIFGAAIAPSLLNAINIKHPISKGIGLGTSAHAVGTSKAIELGELEGTMAGLALILSGIITIIIAPLFILGLPYIELLGGYL